MSKGRQFQELSSRIFRLTTPTQTIKLQSQTYQVTIPNSKPSHEHFTCPNWVCRTRYGNYCSSFWALWLLHITKKGGAAG